MNYLRNRPFLIISFSFVPSAGQNTGAKDFGKSAEWDPIENVMIVDRVSNKLMISSELIIDLLEMKVVKCRSDLNHSDLMQTFISRYSKEIKTALATWVAKNPDNLEKVRALTEKYGVANPIEQKEEDVESNPN